MTLKSQYVIAYDLSEKPYLLNLFVAGVSMQTIVERVYDNECM